MLARSEPRQSEASPVVPSPREPTARRRGAGQTDPRELRLMAKAARLYHERGLNQTEIGERLDLSQATISRLLKRAIDEQIVRITVSVPPGTCPELEDALQARYGLREAVVVETSSEDEREMLRELGAAAAFYVETTLKPGDVVGISSWSATLLALVDAMRPPLRSTGTKVIQILGGVGSPSAEVHATRLTQRLAQLIDGDATLLSAPGVVASAETRRLLLKDPYIRETVAQFERVTIALVGIGSVEPSRLLASSGNVFAPKELETLRAAGAVGDVCLRFFDAQGRHLASRFDERVIGMGLDQLARVPRTIGIAAGARKIAAIRGALAGKLVNVLVTDRATAEKLLTNVVVAAPPKAADST